MRSGKYLFWAKRLKAGQIKISSIFLIVSAILTCSLSNAEGLKSIDVLFVFSWHQNMPWQVEIENGFKHQFKSRSQKSNLFFEYMDAGRFKSKDQVRIFKNYLSGKYKEHQIDYIIYESRPAFKLFDSYPELFKSSRKYIINPGIIRDGIQQDKSTIIPVNADYEKSARHLLEVSGNKAIYLVAGATESGRERVEKFTRLISKFDPEKKIVPLTGLPMGELLQKTASLEPDSIIFYLLVLQDGEGIRHIPYDVAEQICLRSSVPVYSLWTSLLGSGIVGGYLLSGEMVGKRVAAILTDPNLSQNIDYENLSGAFHGYFYDWRQLKRWDLKMKSLPDESTILFKETAFHEHYYREIIAGSLVLIVLIPLIWILILRKEIAERKKVEEKLQFSESRYRGLSDASFEGVLISEKGKIVDANKALEEMFGYSVEETVGMNAIDFMVPDMREDVKEKILSGYEEPYETVGLKKDGTKIPVEVHAKIFAFHDQDVRVAAIRDLSEQKKTQKLLVESERRLSDAQKLAKIGHYVLDVKSAAWTSSSELDQIFGIDKNFQRDVQGWRQIVHPDHREELMEYLSDHVLKKHQKFDKEYKIVNQKNKKEYWVHGTGELKFDVKGDVLEMLGTIQDVTGRRQMEQELRESRQNMWSVLNHTQDMVVRIDHNFRHLFANPALYEATGLSPQEYLGKTNEEIGLPEKLARFWRTKHENVFKTGKPEIFEFSTLTQKKGQRVFQAVVTPEFNAEGSVETIISFMRDITQLKLAESEKNEIIKELEQTLSEVKTLRGLIPICSNCKKIRDDQGYWNNLETYIEKFSDASFSHGLCTDCSDKLYGKEDWYIKMKNKRNQ